MSQFIESQKRMSNLKSVSKEKEIRLLDIEGRSRTKSKGGSTYGGKTNAESESNTTSRGMKPENKPQLAKVTEAPNEEDRDQRKSALKQKKPVASPKKARSKSVFSSKTSEDSLKIANNRCTTKLYNLQKSNGYMIFYYIMYYWLALNDQVRLIFVPKSGDVAFFVFTIMFVIIFVFDIIARAFSEKGYFMNFFFLVDIFCLIVIIYSSTVTDISLFITLSFLKLIMIVKITDLVMNYKAWSRQRLMDKVIKIKEAMKRLENKNHKHDKAYQLKHGLIRKSTTAPAIKNSTMSLKTGDSGKQSSQRVSRYSTVNIAMLNNMKSAGADSGDVDNALSKQTKLEKQVSCAILYNPKPIFCVIKP